MPTSPERVTTRQRAFLEQHGIPADVVVESGLRPDGILVALTDGHLDHPWAENATTLARAGDFLRVLLPYPDDATRDAATEARNGDWRETVGPEAAAIWDRLG